MRRRSDDDDDDDDEHCSAGDAHQSRKKMRENSCAPVPTYAQKTESAGGVRKTSPWTSFQPVSSSSSSSSSAVA